MLRKTASLLALTTILATGTALAQPAPTTPPTPDALAPMSTPAPTPSTTPSTGAMSGTGAMPAQAAATFVTAQATSEFRASKFVGIDIYGADNQKIGDVTEVLFDANGAAKTVVIGVGGFLGIGQKNVAVPYAAVEWKLAPTMAAAPSGTMSGTAPMAGGPATTGSTAPVRSPAETAAYNGYPDHGMIKVTQAELQNAPAFKYVADTTSSSGAASNVMAPAPATRQ